MEILPSNRRNNLPTSQTNADGFQVLPAVRQDTNDPRCKAIVESCGDAARFFGFMTPANLDYIAEHRKDAVCKEKSPALVMVMLTYGQQATEENIKVFVAYVCIRLGLDWDGFEKSQIASTIANTAEARTLPYTYIVGFFKWLCEGRFPLYAGKLANVMEAFQHYAKGANAEVRKVKEEMEHEQRERERQERERNYINPHFDVEAWLKEHQQQ